MSEFMHLSSLQIRVSTDQIYLSIRWYYVHGIRWNYVGGYIEKSNTSDLNLNLNSKT